MRLNGAERAPTRQCEFKRWGQRGRRTKDRPKRLNGLFYLLWFILSRSMGQIRRMGGRKARQKRIFHQTREFYLLSFRRPCTEFDLT